MSELLNMETIYRQEHQRWLREEAPRRSFRDMLAGSIPYWIILVARYESLHLRRVPQ